MTQNLHRCFSLFFTTHITERSSKQSSMQQSTHPSPAPIGCAPGMYSMSMTTPQTPMCAVCPAGTFSAYAAFLCTACDDGKCRFKLQCIRLSIHHFVCSHSIRPYPCHTLSTHSIHAFRRCVQAWIIEMLLLSLWILHHHGCGLRTMRCW